MTDLRGIFTRRAELLRELAELEGDLAEVLDRPTPAPLCSQVPDEALGLLEAARLVGEPPSTFRRRLEYRKALISRPRERRLRYSRAELERIRRDRLAGNGIA